MKLIKLIAALLCGIVATLVAAVLLYEFGKYPGEKLIMNSWKGKENVYT